MKKRILVIFLAVILLAAVAMTGFSVPRKAGFAIGGAFALDPIGTPYPGGAITFKLPVLPPVFGVGFSFGSQAFRLGITGDWWLWNFQLVSILWMYVGPGLWVNINIADSGTGVGLGVRVPVGLELWVIEPLELFLEIAPRVGLAIRDPVTIDWGIQGAVGFRFWF